MKNRQLWLVRPIPRGIDKISYFIKNEIIQVGWNEIGDLSLCQNREDIRENVNHQGLKPQDANLKVGLLYNFRFLMKAGDYCILPYQDHFYVAEITGDYDYEPQLMLQQRAVRFLNEGQPLGLKESLPAVLQKSLRSRLALANLTDHIELFLSHINESSSQVAVNTNEKLQALLPRSLDIIEEGLESSDERNRLLAALAVTSSLKK
ncbi:MULTISPECIES: hypothetical protein [Pontibacillus]|uniref:AraC family transcriptional regulator n=1 Tax=Pontibacillus chungwhensis TaxID=265426 RepID=A0ABY8UX80_9BACI|nr:MULTISPECIES: hypothetical protein [Pontibacillus]MCD5324144.1 hypothetical protein [Pontibacillus sp. HN14]WIF97798.1 hypothetical protein QNI29_19050 [Pontibacillus chungwhensis]